MRSNRLSLVKTVYLHIGTPKTGSTSIQRFLARADEELAEQGTLYPEAGRPDTDWSDQYGQHELYWSIAGKRGVEDEKVWRKLRQEVDEFSGRRVVISAEGFGGCRSGEIRRVAAHLAPHPIHVVVYLRPPIQFLRSTYKQCVKTGTFCDSFAQFVEEMVPQCNYLDLVSRWQRCDAVESLDIQLFDKVKEAPGLEASFSEAVGIDFEKVRSYVGSPVNTSPPDHVVQLARWLSVGRRRGARIEAWKSLMSRARSNVLGQRRPGRWLTRAVRPFLRDCLVTESAAATLRRSLRDAHDEFLSEYISPDDRSYLPLAASGNFPQDGYV